MKHGVFFLLTLWEGLVYSRIPLRAKLLVFPGSLFALYAAWTWYQSHYGPSNPFFYGQDHDCHPNDDDAVYPQVNWRKRPAKSSLSLAGVFVFVPLHYFALWIVSAWSGGCRWDGSQRRFVASRAAIDTHTDDEGDGSEREGLLMTKTKSASWPK